MGKQFKVSTVITAKILSLLLVLQVALFSLTAFAVVKVEPISLTITPATINLFTSGITTKTPTVAWNPTTTDATYKTIAWSSNASGVASVDPNTGLITAVAPGTATIKATSVHNGTITAITTVNVYKTLTSVAYSPSKATVKIGVTTSAYKPVLVPFDASVTTITYASSNTAVANVATNGDITTGSVGGTATITATITLPGGAAKKTATFIVTVPNPTTSVVITKPVSVNYVSLGLKKSLPVAFKVFPLTPVPTVKTVTWTTGNNAIATVDSKGIVTPVSVGVTTITATSDYDPTLTSTVALSVYTDLTSLTLSNVPKTVKVGQTINGPGVAILPLAATVNSVVYSVKQGKPGVTSVTVDSVTGAIYGVAPGTAIITATITAGDIVKKQTFTVTVPVPVTSITLDPLNKITVAVDKSIKLKAAVVPSNAGVKTYRFKSSNYAVASVNGATGEVTGIAAGTATITVTSTDGSFTATTLITVTP